MSVSDQATQCFLPLFRYLVESPEVCQLEFDTYLKDIESGWKSIQFYSRVPVTEVVDYYNQWINKECLENPTIISSENYLFLRYFILICALDSYGRCETIEGMRGALESGRQHLSGGLAASLKRLDPWNHFLDAYGGSSTPLLEWILTVEHPTWFTKLDHIDKEKEKEIREIWRASLQDAWCPTGLKNE